MGFFTIGLETGSQTFPTKFAEPLPVQARYKTLEYQNGFSCNVSYASGNNQIIVQNEATINLTPGTADGESYQLSFVDTSWPTPNSSSYWALQEITNAPVIDENNNILIFKNVAKTGRHHPVVFALLQTLANCSAFLVYFLNARFLLAYHLL